MRVLAPGSVLTVIAGVFLEHFNIVTHGFLRQKYRTAVTSVAGSGGGNKQWDGPVGMGRREGTRGFQFDQCNNTSFHIWAERWANNWSSFQVSDSFFKDSILLSVVMAIGDGYIIRGALPQTPFDLGFRQRAGGIQPLYAFGPIV